MLTDDKESASAPSDGNPIMEIHWRPALRKRDARFDRFTRHRVFWGIERNHSQLGDLTLDRGLADPETSSG